jgi:hypothetical protein
VFEVDENCAPRLRSADQRLQLSGEQTRHEAGRSVPGDGFCRVVPEDDVAFRANQRNALREAIKRGFKQFRAIRHPSLSVLFIGLTEANLTRRRAWEKGWKLLIQKKGQDRNETAR